MANGDGEIGPGEIARTLARLEKAIAALDAKVEGLSFVRQDVWAVEREAIHERIEVVRQVAEADTDEVRKDLAATQDNLRWLARGVAMIVIAAVLATVLAVNGIGPP
ncbi:MAG TPA: hypothetical protein VM345_01875 [Acidimicrobiales bacterium]|nr:hypothetical protein [Acidimicrobiales bacterium]